MHVLEMGVLLLSSQRYKKCLLNAILFTKYHNNKTRYANEMKVQAASYSKNAQVVRWVHFAKPTMPATGTHYNNKHQQPSSTLSIHLISLPKKSLTTRSIKILTFVYGYHSLLVRINGRQRCFYCEDTILR